VFSARLVVVLLLLLLLLLCWCCQYGRVLPVVLLLPSSKLSPTVL
jgi:hypothetical protein